MRQRAEVNKPAFLGPWAVVFIAFLSSGSARGNDDVPPLAGIRDRCRQEQEQFHQLVVAFQFKSVLHCQPSLAEKIDPYRSTPVKSSNRAAFKGPKRFYEQEFPGRGKGGKYPLTMAQAYDGDVTRIYEREGPPDVKAMATMRVLPGNQVDRSARDDYMAYHGFPKNRDFAIYLDNMKERVPVPISAVFDDAACTIAPTLQPSNDSTPCVVVSTARERLWLDPRLKFAVRQREWFGPGKRGVITRIRFSDHAEILPGLWMAKAIFSDYFADPVKYPTLAGKPYRTEEIRVTEIKSDAIADEIFAFRPPAGTYVRDQTKFAPNDEKGYQQVVNYTIPSDPINVEEVVRKATEMARANDSSRSGSNNYQYILINMTGAALIVGLAIWWRTSRKRR
jgi:hypothetical protein